MINSNVYTPPASVHAVELGEGSESEAVQDDKSERFSELLLPLSVSKGLMLLSCRMPCHINKPLN